MRVDEVKVLSVLVAAEGNLVDAEDIQTQTGLSGTDLQSATAGLVDKNFATWVDGSELDGEEVRFYSALVTLKGQSAFAEANQVIRDSLTPSAPSDVSDVQRWRIEHELIEWVHDKAEQYTKVGEDPTLAVGRAFREMVLSRPKKPEGA